MPTILVTGGAGYIGSHTIIELQNAGFNVISVDNYSNSTEQTYNRIHAITNQKPIYYEVDLCDLKATQTLFQRHPEIEGVIHFAAYKAVGESVEEPHKYFYNNIQSQNNILECCKQFGIKNFIFSSSCSVYGNAEQLPVMETTPLAIPESPYAQTKKIGEEILQYSGQFFQIRTIALRYFNPVGAHPSGLNGELSLLPPNNLVPVITETAIGKRESMMVFGNDYPTRDGSCIRDYIHVVDIADAHVKALQYLLAGKQTQVFDVINLGSGEGVSVLEAIEAFEKVSGKKVNYSVGPKRTGDVVAIYSKPQKAYDLLGWTPKYNVEAMMESAWKWQLNLD